MQKKYNVVFIYRYRCIIYQLCKVWEFRLCVDEDDIINIEMNQPIWCRLYRSSISLLRFKLNVENLSLHKISQHHVTVKGAAYSKKIHSIWLL